MRKLAILLIGLMFVMSGYSQDKSGKITKSKTAIAFSLNATDTLGTTDTFTINIDARKDFPATQDFFIELDSVSGTPTVSIQLKGKKFSDAAYANIGSAIEWTGTSGDTTIMISNATENRYRFYQVVCTADATTQKSLVTAAEFKIYLE